MKDRWWPVSAILPNHKTFRTDYHATPEWSEHCLVTPT